jgi:hypothetical protein
MDVKLNPLRLHDLQHVVDQDDWLAKCDLHALPVLVAFEHLMHHVMVPDDESHLLDRCQSQFDLHVEDAQQEEVWWFQNAVVRHQ